MTPEFDQLFQPRQPWAARVDDSRSKPPDLDGEQIVGGGAYKPYGYTPTHDLDSCDISWWLSADTPQGQDIQYRFLVRIAYVADEQVSIMMSDCIIVLDGRRLTDLRKRLARGRVTFIQAFHERIWPRPDSKEPIVEKITILYPNETQIPAPRS